MSNDTSQKDISVNNITNLGDCCFKNLDSNNNMNDFLLNAIGQNISAEFIYNNYFGKQIRDLIPYYILHL